MAESKKTKSWGEMSPAEKKAVIVGWAAIIAVAGYFLIPSGKDQEAPQLDAASAPARPVSATYAEASPDALAAATQFMAHVDQAMKGGLKVLKAGELSAISSHSRAFSALVETGYAQFGSTVFEALGRCGVAGRFASSWWQAQISAAQNNGVESAPDSIQSALNEYQMNRSECLKSAGANG